MEKAIQFWFHGFAEGLDSLEESQRQTLLAQCSKACLQRGDLPRYRSLYEQAEGDCNRFFEKLNELDGVDSEMMVPNRQYCLYFKRCTCPLVREGYLHTPHLCECSRQSILELLRSFWPEKIVTVEACHTILRGDEDCKFLITVS